MNRDMIEILLLWALIAFGIAAFVGATGALMGASSISTWAAIQEVETFLFIAFLTHMAIRLCEKLTK